MIAYSDSIGESVPLLRMNRYHHCTVGVPSYHLNRYHYSAPIGTKKSGYLHKPVFMHRC